jgi:hypothetical protein
MAQRCPNDGEKPGYWSKSAVVICEDSTTKQMHLKVPSPDGKKLLFVNGREFEGTFLLNSDRERTPQELFPARAGAEALWSPDSKAIAVTTCFGAAGPCVMRTTLDLAQGAPGELVKTAFAAGHEHDICYTNANVGALTWEDGSDKIVIIAEVPPSGGCNEQNAGYFEAFVVSLTERKVISRFNMQETIRLWRSILGTGLQSDIKLVREDAKDRRK